VRVLAALTAAATTAGLLGGCGSAASAPKAPRISSKLRAQEEAIHRQVLASLHDDADGHVRYGALPADLRGKQAPPKNQVLGATAAHPAIAIQGNSVELHLVRGDALATAVGPDVPDRIQGSADVHTPATWELTFADVHGTIPIAASLFTITDEQGSLLLPRVSVAGGGRLPRAVPAGRPFTIMLKTVVSVGDGKLRYAPAGPGWLAEWDFDVETD
jgi:hypothetical protein